MDQRMYEAVKVAIQIQSDRLRNEAQVENDEFLKTIDENMQKIIKEQVKEQVNVQVSKILPKIKQTVNEQLEALVEAYEFDKIILDTYGDTVTLKRCRDDDADKDKEPFARSDRGSKRRREGKEPESVSAPHEKATRSANKSTQGFKSRQTSASESATAEEPMQTTFEMEEPSHPEFETSADDQPIIEPSQHPECDLAMLSDSRSSFNELVDTPVDFFAFLINRLKVYTLTPELLAGPTYELMKGSCKSLESARDVYSKRRIIAITELKIVEWHNYKHLDRITKKLNLTKPNTYHSDLKRNEAYIAYSNPRGFIYQNKDKQNKLMRIDELHKFSDGMLTDVRTTLDDRLKGIRMKYLPQSIWRKSDKDRAVAMIQAIDKRLKTRRIMRSLERFVGGRLYEGDSRMLQRTI
nr:hypothetical protein [Tanacetum cinerariifolium]